MCDSSFVLGVDVDVRAWGAGEIQEAVPLEWWACSAVGVACLPVCCDGQQQFLSSLSLRSFKKLHQCVRRLCPGEGVPAVDHVEGDTTGTELGRVLTIAAHAVRVAVRQESVRHQVLV